MSAGWGRPGFSWQVGTGEEDIESGTGFLLYQPDKLERDLQGRAGGTHTHSLLSLEGCGRAGAGTGTVTSASAGAGAPGCATAQLAPLPRWPRPHAHRRRIAGFLLPARVRRPGLPPATLATQGWVLVVQVALGHVALAGCVTGSVLERVGGVSLLVPIHSLPVLVGAVSVRVTHVPGRLVELALPQLAVVELGLAQVLVLALAARAVPRAVGSGLTTGVHRSVWLEHGLCERTVKR